MGMEAVARGRGHPKQYPTTQILGVIYDPPGIAQASHKHWPSNRNNRQNISKTNRKHETSQIFWMVIPDRVHPKKDQVGSDTRGDLRSPGYR